MARRLLGRNIDWTTYLAAFHAARPGITEAILSATTAGGHTPYHWLARAVSPRASVVLDLACGSGPVSRELALPGRTVIGLDLAPAELELAASRGPGPWVCADARRLPLADASVDAVTSSMGVTVIQPTAALFREVGRVLKPGGVFAFTAPTLIPTHPRDMAVPVNLVTRLRSLPRFPGPVEVTGYITAMAGTGLRKVEDARERYHFEVRTPADAASVVEALYLPVTAPHRRQAAIDFLVDRAIRHGSVRVSISMRRFVALKQDPASRDAEL